MWFWYLLHDADGFYGVFGNCWIRLKSSSEVNEVMTRMVDSKHCASCVKCHIAVRLDAGKWHFIYFVVNSGNINNGLLWIAFCNVVIGGEHNAWYNNFASSDFAVF